MKKLKNKLKNLNLAWLLKNHILVILLLAAILFESSILFQSKVSALVDLGKYADQVIETCANSSYHPACYDKTIPQLLDGISMEDAFKVTAIVQNQDRSYVYCHVLAHTLSAREVDKDPSAWKDVVSRVPSGMCSNGGIHGAFQERFRGETFSDEQAEAIKPELNDLCEKRKNWSPTGMEQASCYHALGHLTMYITDADIKRSLLFCDELALRDDGRDFRQLCYDGAFMQIFQPLEGGDFTLIKGKEVSKAEHPAFCEEFTGQQKGSCWTEGWPLYRDELQKPEGLNNYCSKTSVTERDRCYSAIMYVVTALFNLDSSKVLAYCPGLIGDQKGKCFASAAGRMIEIDYRNIEKARDLCSVAEKYDPKHFCFEMILQYSSYNYKIGTPEFYHVCDTLPGDWKGKCLKKVPDMQKT